MIVNQGVADIFHQTVELLRILGVAEKFREITSGYDWVHSLANVLQIPGDPVRQPES